MISFKEGFFYRTLEFSKKVLEFLGVSIKNKKKDNENKLINFVKQQRFGEVAKLIQEGVNLNIKDDNGETLLMIATDRNNSDIVDLLLNANNGADTEIKDKNGETVLVRAIRNGYVDIVDLLINHKANKNVKNKDNKTVPEMVFEYKNKNISEMDKKYSEILKEIQNKGKDSILALTEMREEKRKYEYELKKLDKLIRKIEEGNLNDENISIENLDDLKSSAERYKEICDVLGNRVKYEEVLSKLKNIEIYEEIEKTLRGVYLYEREDYKNVDVKGKFSVSEEKTNVDIEKEKTIAEKVLPEYDYDNVNNNGIEKK